MTRLNSLLKRASSLWSSDGEIYPKFVKKGGWLGEHLRTLRPADAAGSPQSRGAGRQDAQVRRPASVGRLPVREGLPAKRRYPESLTSSQRRLDRPLLFLARRQRREDVIVEFGTAVRRVGHVLAVRHEHRPSLHIRAEHRLGPSAEEVLAPISDRFTFDGAIRSGRSAPLLAPRSVGIAFVDAIHTSEFVFRQYDILKPLMKPGASSSSTTSIFSPDMTDCWRRIAADPSLAASATLTDRVGIIELPG